jgi:hypothetical protein
MPKESYNYTDESSMKDRGDIHSLKDANAGARGMLIKNYEANTPHLDALAREQILKNQKEIDIKEHKEKQKDQYLKSILERETSLKNKISELSRTRSEYMHHDGFRTAIDKEIESAQKTLMETLEERNANKNNIENYEIRQDLENARGAYLEEYKKVIKEIRKNKNKENRSISFKNFFTKSNKEKKKTDEDYYTPEYTELKQRYDDIRVVLGQKMYEEREKELQASGIEISEQIRQLKYYKSGEIFEKIFIEEREKIAKETSNIEKTKAEKILNWYKAQPRWKKVAFSTAIFTTAGAVGAWPFAGGLIAKYGIVSYAGGKFLASSLIGGVAGKLTSGINKLYDRGDKNFKKEKEERMKKLRELNDEYNKGDSTLELLDYEKRYKEIEEEAQKQERKRKNTKLIVGGIVGLGVGAGVGALAYNTLLDGLPEDTRYTPNPKITELTEEQKLAYQENPTKLEKELDEFIVKAERVRPTEIQEDPLITEPENVGPRDRYNRKIMDIPPATTSDFIPHFTESNPESVLPEGENTTQIETNPKYNFGDYDPEKRNLDGNPTTEDAQSDPVITEDSKEKASEIEQQSDPVIENEAELEPAEQNEGSESDDKNLDKNNLEQNPTTDSEQITNPAEPKMDFHETQKIQEAQLQDIKEQLGEKEYNKLIKDLESKNIPYKSDTNALRTIAIGEDSNENFAKTLSRNNANSNLLEQTGQKQASLGGNQIIDSRTYTLDNGEYRKILVIETEKVNGQDVENLFKVENSDALKPETPTGETPLETTVNSTEGVGQTDDEYTNSPTEQSDKSEEVADENDEESFDQKDNQENNPQNNEGENSNPQSESISEPATSIENKIKAGNYKDIINEANNLGFEFAGSRTSEVEVLKFLETAKSGDYKIETIESTGAPTRNLASEMILQKNIISSSKIADAINLWKKTADGYHMISVRLIKNN